MPNTVPFFKPWVPKWLALTTVIAILFPSLVIFALYYNSTLATAEHYGLDAMDIQYSVVLMYATVISYLALDSRLIKCFRIKTYTLVGILINTVTCVMCAVYKEGEIFMFSRFIQGFVCAFLCNICMNLSFTLFNVKKARILGYTVFYGSLMVCVPFSAIFANIILHYFGIDSMFYGFILFQVPGFILLLLTMNNRFLAKKMPLYQIDWTGFIEYTAIACIVGYILVYGQQLEWLESPKILVLLAILIVITPIYVLGALNKKRPLIQLKLLKIRTYRKALLLLTMFYISKGTTFITYVYMQDILQFTAINMVTIWTYNILGIFLGMYFVSKMMLKNLSPIHLIKFGFFTLLIFHTYMFFLFASTGSIEKFYLPIFIQGVGTGSLFVPLIMNMVGSVPPKSAPLVPFLGIASRFMGFCLAIALINYFQLYNTNRNYIDIATNYTISNAQSFQKEEQLKHIQIGLSQSEAMRIAQKEASKTLKSESAIRANMNYYTLLILGILAVLIMLQVERIPIKSKIYSLLRINI